MSLWKIVNIINWTIERYENVKKWSIKKYRTYKTRRVRNLIDDDNIDAVDSIVQSIKKKRSERQDST